MKKEEAVLRWPGIVNKVAQQVDRYGCVYGSEGKTRKNIHTLLHVR